MMALNQIALSSSGSNQSSIYTGIADKAFSCVNEHLTILIAQMLNSADNKLFDLSQQAKSDEERMKFMDCTRIFCTEKNDINRHFFLNLNKKLNVSKENLKLDDTEELSLVDQDEMEEMVAITTMHAKAMNVFGKEVSDLEARLEYLELMCETSIDKESLDPKHICEIFQKTIENVEIAIEVKLVFYKLFDQEVCSKLGVMYKAINQIFIDDDIMPEIILKTTNDEAVDYLEEEVSSRVATYYDPDENVEANFIPRTKQDVSRIVNEFMSGDMTITGDEIELPESFLRVPTQQDLDGKNCYQRKEVIRALSNLQSKLTSLQNTSENLTTEQIKHELLADISKQNGGVLDKQVNLLDERNMDFVGMMFEVITNDETISRIMTNMINRLQIPVMKVAMSDSEIFEQEEHPARVTVDLLTTVGKGINNEEDRLFSDLDEIVNSILEEFDVDIESFEKAVDELEDILHKEEELTRDTERKQQKKILQEHARHIVVSQLKMISCNKKIPNHVRPLVLKHWSTLMLNRYLRHGRDSAQWVQSVLLLRLLLKCIQPIQFQSQYKLLKENQMALIEAVNDELYETQQDKDEIATQIASLKLHFTNMIDEYGLKIVDEDNDEITEEELIDDSSDGSEEELQQIQQHVETAMQKLALLTSSTKPGVWYEIYNGEDKAVRRLKLSVILTDAAKLIFVDRKGLKVIEKDAEEFAKELEDNRSRILADHSTFDYALANVISALAA